MVASSHWLASAAGMAVLEDGGNAFDAAVAAGFVLQVVQPHLNGPAGEIVGLLCKAGDATPLVLCGQGVAPAAATPQLYRALGLDHVPGNGLLAATVPGAWDGWLTLLRDYGTVSLRKVLSTAISYARSGFPLPENASAIISAVGELFSQHWPTSSTQWLPGGKVPRVRCTNPALADTWERLIAEAEAAGAGRERQIDAARRAWSTGFVAEAVDSFCRKAFVDDTGRPHRGLLTGQDLACWEASFEPAVTVDVGEWTLAKCGAWTQGPVLAQQLMLLAGFGAELSYMDGLPTARTVHLAIECAKLAFADREAWYGDAEVPLADLLSPGYADQRRSLVSDHASYQLRPGSPAGCPPKLPALLTVDDSGDPSAVEASLGEPTVSRTGRIRGDTVHLDVVDRDGNLIAVTPSGGWLQSSPTIPSLGFCLGSRAQMFWLDEDLPNSLAPGKRPRTTLSPSLAFRHGEPALGFGTPGGDQQDQWQLCFWLAHTVGGLNLQAAIDAPAWHTNSVPSSFQPRSWRPGELVLESRLRPADIADLVDRGHRVVTAGPWSLGGMSAVGRDRTTGLLRAAANPRGQLGYAVGR